LDQTCAVEILSASPALAASGCFYKGGRVTLRVGIIGCGAIAESHLQALQEQPDCRAMACADVNRAAALRCAEQFDIAHVPADGDELLRRDDLDVVAIFTPPKWHAEFALRAFERGMHVLIEKPLAMNLCETDSLIDAARPDRIASVALMHRYQPVYEAARDMVRAGALGKLQSVRMSLGRNMYTDRRFTSPSSEPRSWLVDRRIAGGGVLMSSSVHFLSVASYLIGDPPAKHVVGRVRRTHEAAFEGIEDDVDIRVRWENGVEYFYREIWSADLPFRAEFVGDAGRIAIVGDDLFCLLMQAQCAGPLPPPYNSLDWQQPVTSEALQQLRPMATLFSGLWADFSESIRRRSHVARLPNLLHARNMQSIVAAAYEAEATGREAAVDWLHIDACHAL
jgi:predicted dehydrogenase